MTQKNHAVLDPRGQPSGVFARSSMASRLDTLNGKKVYLVDVGFPGGDRFWAEVVGWFSRNMPSVNTVLRFKRGDIYQDDPLLWAEVKERGHAIIFGVAG